MFCGTKLKQHIVEHEILGITTSGITTSGVSPLTVKDEGVTVDTEVDCINFTGAGITATQGDDGCINVLVGETDADTQRYFFNVTQTGHGYSTGTQLTPVYKDESLNWVLAQANNVDTLAAGFITEVFDEDRFEITLGGRVTVSGHDLIKGDYYFLSIADAGELTPVTPVSGVVAPLLYVEDDDNVIVRIERANEIAEEPPEVIARIQGLEINVSGLDISVSGLEDRTSELEQNSAQGSSTAPDQVAVWTDFNTLSGFDNFKWSNSSNLLTVAGNISITGTVDGRNVSTDGSNLDSHTADSTIHFTEASIDHGSIGGLSDDDHTQYLTSGRADIWISGKSLGDLGGTHGTLAGLGSDDHTQYVLADGTRNISGTITINGTTTFNNDISLGVGQKIILDDDSDTYITALVDDYVRFYIGGGAAFTLLQSPSTGVLTQRYYIRDANTPGSVIQDSGNGQLFIGVGTTPNRCIVIGDRLNMTKDCDHSLQTDPTLFIHSATDPDTNNTQWIGAYHDKTDGVISVGTGSIKLDANVSFTGTTNGLDHTDLSNIGTNTHAQIDTHIASTSNPHSVTAAQAGAASTTDLTTHTGDSSIHFIEGSIDHGSIGGLSDDDHTQYLLVDGSRAVANDLTVSGSLIADEVQIGAPTDGTYGGILSINNTDSVADTVDRLNDLLALISPAAPGDLTSQSLTISITTYSGKLPSGLSANWGTYTPGDTVTTMVVSANYTLSSPDTSTRFNGGLTTSDGGTVTHVLDGGDADSRDVDQGIGSTGTVELTAIDTYNSIWQKVNAQLNITQSEGKELHAMKHNLAGTSNTYTVYYDDTATSPTFSASPSFSLNSETLKYLSGVAYYTIGTEFLVSYTAAAGIFQKVYHATVVSQIASYGMNNITVNPGSVPAVNDTFVVTDESATLDKSNEVRFSPVLYVRLLKPNITGSWTSTSALARNICTYGTQSTTTYDNFVDEVKRLVLSTDTAWTSSDALTNGNAQVRAGTLQYPNTSEYPGFTGDQVYERKIFKSSASSGTIVFAGLSAYTDIDSYNTGNLNVFLQLETDDIWFDLGRPFGSDNGNGSGDSIANSKGALNSGASSGTSLAFTFGTYNTAGNNNEYRIRIVFRNSTESLTSITGS
jgi:hypothetical protein